MPLLPPDSAARNAPSRKSAAHSVEEAEEARVQKIYEQKCVHPSLEDILNAISDLQQSAARADASKFLQAWGAEDAVFGAVVRQRFKASFLAVAEIDAFWEKEGRVAAADGSA